MLTLAEVLIWLYSFWTWHIWTSPTYDVKLLSIKTYSRSFPQIPRQKSKITKVHLGKTEILPLLFQKPCFITIQNQRGEKKALRILNFCPEVLCNIYDLNVKKHWLSSFTSQQLIMCSLHLISIKQRQKQKPRELFTLVLVHVWIPVGSSIWLAFGL